MVNASALEQFRQYGTAALEFDVFDGLVNTARTMQGRLVGLTPPRAKRKGRSVPRPYYSIRKEGEQRCHTEFCDSICLGDET